MTKREVIRLVLEGQRPPYVPWSLGFTKEARQKLQAHYGCEDVEGPLQNHLLKLGRDIGLFTELGDDRLRDVFGVVWDRSVDKDIGVVRNRLRDCPHRTSPTLRTSPIRTIRRGTRASTT